MRYIVPITALMAAALSATAAESPDSARTSGNHVLNAVEVVGVKQMPSPGGAAVTRIPRAEISRLGIVSMRGIGEIAPNFYIPAYGSRMTSSVYVRGLGSRMDQAVVGLNVDGVPYLNKDNYDFDMPDIASIEVIRGAQSVLGGRNTMGGQVNILTLSPRDYNGLRFMAEYGRFNSAKASAGWYGKLSPTLAASVTGYYTHTDGHWRNTYNNSRTGRENAGSLRWKTAFNPSAHHSITNTFAAGISRQAGYPYENAATGTIAYNDTCFYRRNSFSDGLTVAWAGKRVVVTSLTSVQYLDDNMTLDQDFTPEKYFTLMQRRHEWTFTEDLFTKGTRGKYSWLGGVFGFYKRTAMKAPVTFGDTGIADLIENNVNSNNPHYPIRWDDRNFLLGSEFTTRDGGFALYHQSEYRVGSWLFEAGLRWDIEHVSCDYLSDADASYTTYHLLPDGSTEVYGKTPVNIHDRGTLSTTFNQLLPQISATYRFAHGDIYANISKGYKAGGFNTQMFSDVLQQRVMETMGITPQYKVEDIVKYRPEKSWNYEIGARTNWMDGRLDAEATVFFIDCSDQQLTMFPPGTVTGRIMTNAGRTYSRGFELAGTWRPTDDFTFRASYGFTHATFQKYNNGREDLKGKTVPYAPKNTLFASALWHIPGTIAGARASIGANVRGVGPIQWDEANTVSQNFYALLGASAQLQGDGWAVELRAENITSTRYNTFHFRSMNRDFLQRGLPAWVGATVKININND